MNRSKLYLPTSKDRIVKFELKEFNRNLDDSDLLKDLKAVRDYLSTLKQNITFRKYKDLGKYSPQTMAERFGSWNKALEKAGIVVSDHKNIPLSDLFENIEYVWRHKGRQPTIRDMKGELSKYSDSAYLSRFSTWRKALEAFIDFIDGDRELGEIDKNSAPTINQSSRSVSLRLRFKVLSRDNFTCQSCGASPAKNSVVELHVDHIIPWSKGGETVEYNLETKCKDCNLGKGNEFNV